MNTIKSVSPTCACRMGPRMPCCRLGCLRVVKLASVYSRYRPLMYTEPSPQPLGSAYCCRAHTSGSAGANHRVLASDAIWIQSASPQARTSAVPNCPCSTSRVPPRVKNSKQGMGMAGLQGADWNCTRSSPSGHPPVLCRCNCPRGRSAQSPTCRAPQRCSTCALARWPAPRPPGLQQHQNNPGQK